MVVEGVTFQNSKGESLYGRYSQVRGSDYAVVICPGYNTFIDEDEYVYAQKTLNFLGISTLIFPYFGQLHEIDPSVISTSECLDDTTKAYELARKDHLHVGFIGVSLGGLAAILASAELKDV